MKYKVISIVFMIISIILMATPYGVEMRFSESSEYLSYFNGLVFGYGNLLPILTAILSVIVLLLLILNIKTEAKKSVRVLLLCCIIMTLLSWLVFNSLTIVSLLITLLHALTLLMQLYIK